MKVPAEGPQKVLWPCFREHAPQLGIDPRADVQDLEFSSGYKVKLFLTSKPHQSPQWLCPVDADSLGAKLGVTEGPAFLGLCGR